MDNSAITNNRPTSCARLRRFSRCAIQKPNGFHQKVTVRSGSQTTFMSAAFPDTVAVGEFSGMRTAQHGFDSATAAPFPDQLMIIHMPNKVATAYYFSVFLDVCVHGPNASLEIRYRKNTGQSGVAFMAKNFGDPSAGFVPWDSGATEHVSSSLVERAVFNGAVGKSVSVGAYFYDKAREGSFRVQYRIINSPSSTNSWSAIPRDMMSNGIDIEVGTQDAFLCGANGGYADGSSIVRANFNELSALGFTEVQT